MEELVSDEGFAQAWQERAHRRKEYVTTALVTEEVAIKADQDKVPVDLVPGDVIYAIGAALEFGAKKYGRWNWAKGFKKSRLLGAMMRHWIAYQAGQENDPESGLPHTWHMAATITMLIGGDLRGVSEDDRSTFCHAMVNATEARKNALDRQNCVSNDEHL